MPVLVKCDMPAVAREQYEAIRKEINWDEHPPAGALLHMAAFDDAGMHAIDIWESRDAFQAYLDRRFNPALRTFGLDEFPAEILDLDVIAVSPGIEPHFLLGEAVA